MIFKRKLNKLKYLFNKKNKNKYQCHNLFKFVSVKYKKKVNKLKRKLMRMNMRANLSNFNEKFCI